MKTIALKNSVSIFIMAIIALWMSSCEPDKLMTFETGRADVYFLWPSDLDPNGPGSRVQEGLNPFRESKFDLVPFDTIVQSIPIRVMGALSNDLRPVNFRIISDSTDAIEGIHYIMPTAFINPNSANGSLRITTIRPPLEHARQVRLWIELIPNEHFGTDFDSIMWNVSQGRSRSVLNYHIFVSDVLTKPLMWDDALSQLEFGYYSDAKYRLLIRLTGYPPAFWERQPGFNVDGRTLTPADVTAAGTMMRFYLYARWVAWMNWETDEDGNRIQRVMEDDGETPMTVPRLLDMIYGQ